MGFFHKVTHAIGHAVKSVGHVAESVGKAALPAIAGSLANVGAGKLADLIPGGSLGGIGDLAKEALGGVGSQVQNSIQQSMAQSGRQPSVNYSFTGGNSGDSVSPYAGLPVGSMQIPNPKSATEQGQDTRAYLAAAYPELNPWERSGTGGTMFGAGLSDQSIQTSKANNDVKVQMALQAQNNAKDLAIAKINSQTALANTQLNNQTAIQSAGIASQTSRQNTADQVSIGQQNVDIQKTRLQFEVNKIAADTSMSIQSRAESISRTILNEAANRNAQLTSGQIIAQTQAALASAGVSGQQAQLVAQQTVSEQLRQPGITQANQNLRYGQGPVMGMLNSAGNFAEDASNSVQHWWSNVFDKGKGVQGSMSTKEPTQKIQTLPWVH